MHGREQCELVDSDTTTTYVNDVYDLQPVLLKDTYGRANEAATLRSWC